MRPMPRLPDLRLQQVHFVETEQEGLRRAGQVFAQQTQRLLHAGDLALRGQQLQPQTAAPMLMQKVAQGEEEAAQIVVEAGSDGVPEGAFGRPRRQHGRAQAALATAAHAR